MLSLWWNIKYWLHRGCHFDNCITASDDNYSAANDKYFFKMMKFPFHCNQYIDNQYCSDTTVGDSFYIHQR